LDEETDRIIGEERLRLTSLVHYTDRLS
jgi:hypothetical protein